MVFCVEMSSITSLYIKNCVSSTQIICLTSTYPKVSEVTVPVIGLKHLLSTQTHAIFKELKSSLLRLPSPTHTLYRSFSPVVSLELCLYNILHKRGNCV